MTKRNNENQTNSIYDKKIEDHFRKCSVFCWEDGKNNLFCNMKPKKDGKQGKWKNRYRASLFVGSKYINHS